MLNNGNNQLMHYANQDIQSRVNWNTNINFNFKIFRVNPKIFKINSFKLKSKNIIKFYNEKKKEKTKTPINQNELINFEINSSQDEIPSDENLKNMFNARILQSPVKIKNQNIFLKKNSF